MEEGYESLEAALRVSIQEKLANDESGRFGELKLTNTIDLVH